MNNIKVTAESGGVVNTTPFKLDKETNYGTLENLSKIIAIGFKVENNNYDCVAVNILLFNDDKNNIYMMVHSQIFSSITARLLLVDFLRRKDINKIGEYIFTGVIKHSEFNMMQCCYHERDMMKIVNLTNDEMNSYNE
jgi:hypothetical protein